MPNARLQIVWFKRDLRVTDHAALAEATARGPVLPLYVIEPEIWRQPDASGRQYAFLAECLAELDQELRALGHPLVIRTGPILDVLEALTRNGSIGCLWSHEETGNAWTFQRDRAVAAWASARGIPWTQCRQTGVIRRLQTRNGWAAKWDAFMALPPRPAPSALPRPASGIDFGHRPDPAWLGLAADPCPGRQRGGRRAGLALLDSFLDHRGQGYRVEMSSPVTAFEACSRLSPHIAYGTVSLREITHAMAARLADLRLAGRDPTAPQWRAALSSFSARLHWHCHFIQKLESEPALEFRNLHRAYDGLRPDEADPVRFAAWASGNTGYPFVDACMRALIATGWLNFRMRAMLVSFASYQLWLPWRPTGLHLARLFTDYEPGIHWPQVQMQSGTTGINTVRLYNPVKQGYDQDPAGTFVRRWVPELAELPDHAIHEPWRFAEYRTAATNSYPPPIVDHIAAAREARDKVWGVRAGRPYRAEADTIQDRHGSRKSGVTGGVKGQARRRRLRATQADTLPPLKAGQLEFDL